MNEAQRQFVHERAHGRCEHCHLAAQDAPFLAFHIDPIMALQHGGTDAPDNLALACLSCNLHKGPNLSGIDPESGAIVPLFHPRREPSHMHFMAQGFHILGRTPTGRATVRVLTMNAPERVELRIEYALGSTGAINTARKPQNSRSANGRSATAHPGQKHQCCACSVIRLGLDTLRRLRLNATFYTTELRRMIHLLFDKNTASTVSYG